MTVTVLALGLLLAALPPADLSGKWSGSFDVENSQGEKRTEPIMLILKQDGSTISGSGGPHEGEQHPIQNGKISGDKLEFEVAMGRGSILFDLTASETEIKGTMSRTRNGEKQSVQVSLKRADAK